MQNSGLRLSDTVCTAPLGPKYSCDREASFRTKDGNRQETRDRNEKDKEAWPRGIEQTDRCNALF